MNQGLSYSIPILLILQTFGVLIAVVPFFLLSGSHFKSSSGKLAIGGAALTAYSPLLHVGAILTLGSGLPTPYVGLACYAIGIVGFIVAVLQTRRWRSAISLAPLGVCAAWTFFILRVLASGF